MCSDSKRSHNGLSNKKGTLAMAVQAISNSANQPVFYHVADNHFLIIEKKSSAGMAIASSVSD